MRLLVLMLVVLSLSACSTLLPKRPLLESSAEQVGCEGALAALDELAFKAAGTLHAERIGNVPWLRSQRLIEAQRSSQSLEGQLNAMALAARRGLLLESKIIAAPKLEQWRQAYAIHLSLADYIQTCQQRLLAAQLKNPAASAQWLQQLTPDKDYSQAAKILGFYPLTVIPFRQGVLQEQARLQADWGRLDATRWFEYTPAFIDSNQDNLQRLIQRHAPIWRIDSQTSFNRPGTPQWQGEHLRVNTDEPVSFTFVTEALWQEQPLLQLNYVIWFSERPPLRMLDWVAGQHDAVIFRVNLDVNEQVVAYDSIHLCGCWYRLFLSPETEYQPLNDPQQEPVLMHRVDFAAKDGRMRVYLQADTHHIRYISPVNEVEPQAHTSRLYVSTPVESLPIESPSIESLPNESPSYESTPYTLRPFDDLLSLPSVQGPRPVFNRQGYVWGSERLERWFFWPMGVKNPGALRRVGDHAISFIGERYFDDPYLLIKLGVQP